MDSQEQEKKQFSVPSRDQLIQQIKDLDQDIQHVTLNLIKCDFNATEKDIQKAFPDFNFIKIKNYNPGSFEVIFQMRIDAINFIRNHYDKKILTRRFFIKMGRQQKQVIQNWTGVGNAQRQFKAPHKPHQNKNQSHGQQKIKQSEQQNEGQKSSEQTKPQVKEPETKPQLKQIVQTQQPIKKQGKIIPKSDTHHKKPQNKKYVNHEGEKKSEALKKKQDGHQAAKKEQNQNLTKKVQQHQTKGEETHQKIKKPQAHGDKKEVHHKGEKQHSKKVDEKQHSKAEKQNSKKVDEKQHSKAEKQLSKRIENKKEEKKIVQKASEQTEKKQQDEGWIVVGSKNPKKK